MSIPEQCRFILLDEIDENIIAKVRDVNEHSDAFRILTNSISMDRQRHPITLRKLNEEELKRAKPGALYGIIDGHHRFKVALNLKQSHISSIIINAFDKSKADRLSDLKLALRLNESSLKMSSFEKGKIIYETANLTKRDPICIAEEIFGIKTSMAYRCLNVYKKAIGEKVIFKSRNHSDFDLKHFKASLRNFSKIKALPQTVDECISSLNEIKALEKDLRIFKNFLLAQNGVRDLFQ